MESKILMPTKKNFLQTILKTELKKLTSDRSDHGITTN